MASYVYKYLVIAGLVKKILIKCWKKKVQGRPAVKSFCISSTLYKLSGNKNLRLKMEHKYMQGIGKGSFFPKLWETRRVLPCNQSCNHETIQTCNHLWGNSTSQFIQITLSHVLPCNHAEIQSCNHETIKTCNHSNTRQFNQAIIMQFNQQS